LIFKLFHLRLEPGVEKDALCPETSQPLQGVVAIVRTSWERETEAGSAAACGGGCCFHLPAPLQTLGCRIIGILQSFFEPWSGKGSSWNICSALVTSENPKVSQPELSELPGQCFCRTRFPEVRLLLAKPSECCHVSNSKK